MRDNSGFEMDFSAFEKDFNKLVKIAIPGAIPPALVKAAAEVLRDADNEVPRTPFKEGHLRGSDKIEEPKLIHGGYSIVFGKNISYATKMHEMERKKADKINWNLPGSGPKFIESKLARNKKKYMSIVAKSIKNAMKP